MKLFKTFLLLLILPTFSQAQDSDIVLVSNENGPTLGYSTTSGVSILKVDGKSFKDLNKNGVLDPYEDWRLPVEARAKNLASIMTVEQIAGLMLYSGHQSVPAGGMFGRASTYDGKPYPESGANPYDLTDQQIKFLTDDNLRHVLITSVESPEVAAKWSNNVQKLVEGLGLGIPANNSSDPRHGSDSYAEYNAGAGGEISMWPGTLGLAATFDPDLMRRFGEVASIEYRALGITTALSPQIDLATEPRWSRFDGTVGEDPDLATDLARAYVDGFQSSTKGGWGDESVNAMVKHWPGGGPEEGGRDAHFGYGAYAVYPENNIEDHLQVFTEGAFKLEGGTSKASAVMPYYTISWDQDTKNGEQVGNGYSEYLISDLLRGTYDYEGVVCTDWMITTDVSNVYEFRGKPWGVETLSVAERHYKAIKAGVDQFGGNNEMGPVIEAYNTGVEEFGEKNMRQRFEASAVRLLLNIFRTGMFENPYLDSGKTAATVGNPEFMKEGFEAQLKSVVMLKNQDDLLPLAKGLKVYLPERFVPAGLSWLGFPTPERTEFPINPEIVAKYFEIVDDPAEADFALVGIENPKGGVGYSVADMEEGGNGYIPISLQYETYTAEFARETSIAGGSPYEDFTNRTYNGKSSTASNKVDLDLVKDTFEKMAGKPVIVSVKASNPMVFSELDVFTSAVFIHVGVQGQALLDLITGAAEPSGLLPYQMPANMKTVEEQAEDVPRDMVPYTDSEGNSYDFGFGLNWKGVISDWRTEKYKN